MGETDRSKALSDAEVESLAAVLTKLSLLPQTSSKEQGATTKAAIEDFTLNITATTQRLVQAVTGTGAIAGVVASVVSWTSDQGDVVVATCIASTALVLSVGLHALARVMDGDVRGRASAGTAAVEARGAVARSLIDVYSRAAGSRSDDEQSKAIDLNALADGAAERALAKMGSQQAETAAQRPSELQVLLATAAFERRTVIRTSQGESTIDGVRWTDEDQLEVKLIGGDWVGAHRIRGIRAEV